MAEMPEWLAIVPLCSLQHVYHPTVQGPIQVFLSFPMVLQLHPDWDTLQHLDFTTSIVVFYWDYSYNITATSYVTLCELRGPWLRRFYTPICRSQSQDFPEKKPRQNELRVRSVHLRLAAQAKRPVDSNSSNCGNHRNGSTTFQISARFQSKILFVLNLLCFFPDALHKMI